VATLRGEATQGFAYESLGIMASLGARRGVAGIQGKYLLTGFLAWLLWRSYYLARLPGLDRQFRVAFDWSIGLLFPRDIAELRVYSQVAERRAAREGGVALAEADLAVAEAPHALAESRVE
jgi:NADH dehydrogenase